MKFFKINFVYFIIDQFFKELSQTKSTKMAFEKLFCVNIVSGRNRYVNKNVKGITASHYTFFDTKKTVFFIFKSYEI